MTIDEFFAEAKRLGCRMVPDNPADVRTALDLKDAEIARLQAQVDALADALVSAESALSDIGDADREPGDDLHWCENRAAEALPAVRDALSAIGALT